MSERDLVAWLRSVANSAIGDDCFLYRPRAGEELVFTTDQSIENVHFLPDLPPSRVGQRAVARALSDIAAMGGEPRFTLISLAVPPSKDVKWIKAFFLGAIALARSSRAPLSGGDLARSNAVYIDVVVCGAVPRGKALRRDKARPGDAIYVSGPLGKAWNRRRIEPRLDFGRSLRGRATACMDISDGLSLDLRRMCEASQVSAELETVPISRGSTMERALHGGEDYELLFTMPPRIRPPKGSFRIGTILGGIGLRVTFQGRDLSPQGYDHFKG